MIPTARNHMNIPDVNMQICKYKLLPFNQTTSQLISADNQSKNTRGHLSAVNLSNPHGSPKWISSCHKITPKNTNKIGSNRAIRSVSPHIPVVLDYIIFVQDPQAILLSLSLALSLGHDTAGCEGSNRGERHIWTVGCRQPRPRTV